ncbi:transcriptional regulator [Amycolatopsis eburnea]|uniref:Transcriptional regulator n=1 Tax=Amycolatopsis eburnea TaxID=2267691 RepID=A0A3R9DVT2_9PSEU|nr:transcriptional regulator [Amycolatopsis eburnea]RSD13127.1 transcriptional regulator [Amycolatopsis eburnea]
MPVDRRRAIDAVIAAFTAVGVTAASSAEDLAASLTVEVNGVRLNIDVEVAATVTPESLTNQLHLHSDSSLQSVPARLLVADRIVAAARERLREHGWSWLDLRGHLHLSGPGVLVDTAVPPAPDLPRPVDLFAGKVALEVACALLLTPGRPGSVRQLARELNRSPSSVSVVMNSLREAQLIDSEGLPVAPELFWEAASAWRPAKTTVARVALLADATIAGALHTGWDEPLTGVGWALTDTMAAAAYGAPAGVRAGYPPDFYVPDTTTAHRAETLLGVPTSDAARGATIRIAPVPQVCSLRFPASPDGPPWPLAHPLFVALDLAADPGRGREILEGWNPPQEVTRVW